MITNTYDNLDAVLSKWLSNRVVVTHTVSDLQIVQYLNDYSSFIKETLAKHTTQELLKKISFTKKFDHNSQTHEFIGRVWCFTEQELKELIKESRNV
jgi:hypothetical protein